MVRVVRYGAATLALAFAVQVAAADSCVVMSNDRECSIPRPGKGHVALVDALQGMTATDRVQNTTIGPDYALTFEWRPSDNSGCAT